ncbi:MAG: hypothetical protein KBT45_06130 [Bacteroidales bacterium]|nr:hypothetical protein [Candidatus Colimorpha pelethequi]
MSKIKQFLVIVLAMLCMTACDHWGRHKGVFDPDLVKFNANYNPTFDNQLYPSFLLALNSYSGPAELEPFTVSVTSPVNNGVLRVVLDSSSLNYVSILQETLPKKGERYTFHPIVKWKYDKLYATRQSGNIDLTFTCYINDEEVDIKNLKLQYRSVNECPLNLRDASGHNVDVRWMFAGYVNEDHPYIENILTETLNLNVITRFNGYQKNAEQVKQQVFAIWYYALNHGIAYSSISCTSNPSKRTNVQHIRFFDEVYNTRQANCVDACVFFASILRKIGLKPVIFVEPCHAYLGYYTDKNRKNIALLETTITGWVNFPELQRSLDEKGKLPPKQIKAVSQYLSEASIKKLEKGELEFVEMKEEIAKTLFEQASVYDEERYKNNKENFADTTKITYQMLDIEQLRKVVQPIN